MKGKIVEQGVTVEGKKEGFWITHDRIGGRIEATYEKGLYVGDYKGWSRDGDLAVEMSFEGGKRLSFRRLHPGGKLAETGPLREGKRHGVWKTWHPDGSLGSEIGYEDDVLSGRSVAYTTAGDMISDTHYVKGQPTGLKRNFRNKVLVLAEHWKDRKRHGRSTTRDERTGDTLAEGDYEGGRKTGEWRHYLAGKLSRTEMFAEGRLTKRCEFAGGRRCTRFVAQRSLPGCRVILPADKHLIANSDAELARAIECPKGAPEVDWKTESVFAANFSVQSNSSHRWTSTVAKGQVTLQLAVGFACQGARIVVRPAPMLTVVKTGGLPLRYKLKSLPSQNCGGRPRP